MSVYEETKNKQTKNNNEKWWKNDQTYLRDDGDFGAKIIKTILSNVDPIHSDGPPSGFNDAKEGKSQGGLPSSCASHDSNLRESSRQVSKSSYNCCCCYCC